MSSSSDVYVAVKGVGKSIKNQLEGKVENMFESYA